MFRPSYYQLALSYNHSTRITHGLLLSKTREHEIPQLIEELKEEQDCCKQPLFLSLLVTEVSLDACAERIQFSDLRLNDLERKMGQHEFANWEKGNPLEIDFESTTGSLNFLIKWLAVQDMRLEGVILALDEIIHDTKEIAEEDKSGIGTSRLPQPQTPAYDSLRMMSELAAYQVNACKNLLLRSKYDSERAKAFTQVVRSRPGIEEYCLR